MALQDKKFLDLPGLQKYDELLKALIPEPDGTTIDKDANGKLKIKKMPSVDTENELLILS